MSISQSLVSNLMRKTFSPIVTRKYTSIYDLIICRTVDNVKSNQRGMHLVRHPRFCGNSNRLGGLSCIQRAFCSNNMPSSNEESRHLDFQQLLENKSSDKTYLIDVREKNELEETGKIPGAFHIPLGDIETALKVPNEEFEKLYNFSKPSPEDNIIFSCRSGKRSLVALEKALSFGYVNAKHYKGGWLDWEKNTSEKK